MQYKLSHVTMLQVKLQVSVSCRSSFPESRVNQVITPVLACIHIQHPCPRHTHTNQYTAYITATESTLERKLNEENKGDGRAWMKKKDMEWGEKVRGVKIRAATDDYCHC